MEYGLIVANYIAQEIKNVLIGLHAQEKYIAMIKIYQNENTNWCVDAPEKFSNHYKAPKLILNLDEGKNVIEQCVINGTHKALAELGEESRVIENDD